MDQQLHFRRRKAQGFEASLPIFHNNDPQEASCSKCGLIFNKYISKCTSCGTKHWCKWDKNFYKNPLTSASSGTSEFTRNLGKYFAAVSIVYYACALANNFLSGISASKITQLYLLGMVYFYAIYEIWAFTQGKRTHTNTSGYFNLDPDLENTTARVYFLAIDIIIAATLSYVIAITTS